MKWPATAGHPPILGAEMTEWACQFPRSTPNSVLITSTAGVKPNSLAISSSDSKDSVSPWRCAPLRDTEPVSF